MVLAYGAAWLSLPRFAFACSCAAPDETMRMLDTEPRAALFSGEAAPAVGADLPVAVSTWYRGPAAADVVVLKVAVGEGDSCGMQPPPPGEYLFLAWQGDDGRLGIGLCSLFADLDTPEGQAYLATAEELYGEAAAPVTPQPSPSAAPTEPADTATDLALVLAPAAIVSLFAIGVVGGALLILRRRSAGPPRR